MTTGDRRAPDHGRPIRLHPDLNPNPLLRIEFDGAVSYMNQAARTAFGEDLAIGTSWPAAWPQLDPAAWERLIADGGHLRHECATSEQVFAVTLVRAPDETAVFAYGIDVTELRRAQEELAEQANELRENALFPEMNPGPVFRLDLTGTVLRANRAAFTIFGEDLIGRNWTALVQVAPEAWTGIVDAGQRHWTEAQHGDAHIGFTLARPEGSAFVYVYGADISALKQAERTMQEMALFPEMNPGPVLRVDADGVILLGNRAARALFEAGDLVGRNWLDLCPGLSRSTLDRVRETHQTVSHEAAIGERQFVFTHAAGMSGREVFVFGADLTDLAEAERALRQAERMATLGTLAAGVAHELNNPSAAVQRAAQHLAYTLGQLQSAQLALSRLDVPDEVLALVEQLDARAQQRAADPPDFDPVSRNDFENDVETWLEDQGIDEAWDLAPSLVGVGMRPEELDELAETLPTEALAAVVVWLARAFPVYSVLEEIHHGTGRISEIVSALKAYSYVDQAPVQAVDVNEGIRHTLIILQNKLKQGVTVDLNLDPDLERIQAYGGDLNQVWTNLIDNAVDAIAGEGRIAIRSANEDGFVRVEIEDEGPGIPAEIQGRVFDPFFTTKAPGEGTGLGLNTTYTIVVKKHGGRIELHSQPGTTTFVVRLPHVLGGTEAASDAAQRGSA